MRVQNVTVLNDTEFLVFMFIRFVGNADHHKFMRPDLPHSVEGALNVCHAIRITEGLFNEESLVFALKFTSSIL